MRFVSLSLALCVLAACVHTTPRTGADQADEPLRVRLLTSQPSNRLAPTLSFTLNRPAYVAAYQVLPGRGVQLLYPYAAQQQLLAAGRNQVVEMPSFLRDYLLPSWMPMAYGQPQFTYLVASEEPLELGALGTPGGLLRYFGIERYATSSPAFMMDEIATAILPPNVADGLWDADVVYRWPNPIASLTRSYALISIDCADGSSMILPRVYGARHCPGDPLRTQMVWTVDNGVPVRVAATPPDNGRETNGRTVPTSVMRDPAGRSALALRAGREPGHVRSEPSLRSGPTFHAHPPARYEPPVRYEPPASYSPPARSEPVSAPAPRTVTPH